MRTLQKRSRPPAGTTGGLSHFRTWLDSATTLDGGRDFALGLVPRFRLPTFRGALRRLGWLAPLAIKSSPRAEIDSGIARRVGGLHALVRGPRP